MRPGARSGEPTHTLVLMDQWIREVGSGMFIGSNEWPLLKGFTASSQLWIHKMLDRLHNWGLTWRPAWLWPLPVVKIGIVTVEYHNNMVNVCECLWYGKSFKWYWALFLQTNRVTVHLDKLYNWDLICALGEEIFAPANLKSTVLLLSLLGRLTHHTLSNHPIQSPLPPPTHTYPELASTPHHLPMCPPQQSQIPSNPWPLPMPYNCVLFRGSLLLLHLNFEHIAV